MSRLLDSVGHAVRRVTDPVSYYGRRIGFGFAHFMRHAAHWVGSTVKHIIVVGLRVAMPPRRSP